MKSASFVFLHVKRDQKALLWAGVAALALWVVPVLRPLLWPLLQLNTHVHEFCHAIAAIVTGGTPQYILVNGDGSGLTPVTGGSILVTASAGYVGAAAVGSAILAWSRTAKDARTALWSLFGALVVSMALFVRGDLFGVAGGLLWIGILPVFAKATKPDTALFLARFVGFQMALTSLQALLALLQISTLNEAQSDARIMQQSTGVPDVFWAGTWSVIGLSAVSLALRRAWGPATREHN